jgi:hypothetical protein
MLVQLLHLHQLMQVQQHPQEDLGLLNSGLRS